MEREKISLGLQGIDDEFIINAKNKKRHWSRTTMGKVALVACLPLLCAASIATGVFVDVVEVFAPLFGGANAQTEIIQEIGRPIGASATSNGVTITVDAIIGDENMAVIQYSISYEDGTPFPMTREGEYFEKDGQEHLYFGGFDVYEDKKGDEYNSGANLKKFTTSLQYTRQFQDKNPDDGTIEFLEIFRSNDLPLRKKVTAHFENLSYLYIVTENGIFVSEDEYFSIDGEWDIDFIFDYGKSSTTFDIQDSFFQEGREIFVESIVISPFSVYFVYDFQISEKELELWEKGIENLTEAEENELLYCSVEDRAFLSTIDLFLTKIDGTKISHVNGTGSMVESKRKNFTSTQDIWTFDEIIPLEDIATLTFGDIVLILEDYLP